MSVGDSYLTARACSRFLTYIFDEFMEAQITALRNSPVFSILVDAATDVSTKDLIAVYCRHLVEGRPVNTFIGVEELQHCNAQGYVAAIDSLLQSVGLQDWQGKTVGFGSDGAAVMIGAKSGVATRLRNDSIPWLVNIQCLAHGLELAAMDVLKSHPVMLKIHDLLKGVHKQYHYSPKAWRELKSVGEALQTKVWKPTNLGGTRWLPHIKAALETMMRNFGPLTVHLQETASAQTASADMVGRAKNASKLLCDHKNLLYTHFFLDILSVLSRLSLQLQADALTLPKLLANFETALLTLIGMKTEDGDHLEGYRKDSSGGLFDGQTLKNCNQDTTERFQEERVAVLDSVHKALTNRFKCLDTDGVIKAASKLVDPRDWPDEPEELALFGAQDIQLLLGHFAEVLGSAGCDVKAARRDEWPALKTAVKRLPRSQQGQGLIQEMMQHEDKREDFKNLFLLMETILVLPLSTASCERCFSAMKRVKSDWRSNLQTATLSKLLYISVEGPEIEDYDCQPALERWWQEAQGTRRPHQSDSQSQ